MAHPNAVVQTQQDFETTFRIFPAGGLSGGLPAGGTDSKYKFIQRLDIAYHDMTLAVADMKGHIAAEKARLGLSASQTRILRDGCRRSLLAAWLASHHLAPGGGQSTFTHERTPEEQIMPSRWPTMRQNKINEIIQAPSPNAVPTPAAMTQIPAWYNTQRGLPAPVQR